MTRTSAVIAIFLLPGLAALAEFKMPNSVYRMARLEQAKTEAASKGRPITFVYTHEGTTCGHCANASLNIVDKLRSRSVMVYVDYKTEKDLLPDIVRAALRKPEAGRYVPKTVIVDAGITNVLAIVPYARGDEQDKLLKRVGADLWRRRSGSATAQKPLVAPVRAPVRIPPAANREMRTWTSRAGVSIKASLFEELTTHLVLQKEDGTKVMIAGHDLSQPDQDYIQALKKSLSDQKKSEGM